MRLEAKQRLQAAPNFVRSPPKDPFVIPNGSKKFRATARKFVKEHKELIEELRNV
jgi:hypothetical protein